MSVLQTVLLFAGIPVAVFVVVSLLVLGGRMRRRPRYRVGGPWDHLPQLWSADPEAARLEPGRLDDPTATTGRGGARGSW